MDALVAQPEAGIAAVAIYRGPDCPEGEWRYCVILPDGTYVFEERRTEKHGEA